MLWISRKHRRFESFCGCLVEGLDDQAVRRFGLEVATPFLFEATSAPSMATVFGLALE